MSWQCVLLDGVFDEVLDVDPWPPIGTMWYVQAGKVPTDRLSVDHVLHRNGQPTLWVRIPGGPFCLDMCTREWATWIRMGDPPRITVSPSINEVGIWHGYIRDGMITDDVEGRAY